ncbi:MAG: hypothetical protein K6G56_00315 [Clostridiales bacterium]|nr:hypothetical protein [Clostridiales bacterium]
MYFSKRNEDTVYINHYSGLLEVEGEGVLERGDAEVWPEPDEDWASEYDTLSVKDGITGIGEGYLEAFPYIGCLILGRTVERIDASSELCRSFRKNKVLIRGEYDTLAERFADENGLRFLHCDIPLADDDIREHFEHDVITLRFHTRTAPDIHYNCFTPGSSAGSYGGGEYAKKLPRNFFAGCTLEQFADNFPERIRDQLMNNDMLKRFLETANRRLAEKK